MSDLPESLIETALGWHRDGRGVALATVIETWGASPCPAGSQLAISGHSDIAGSVSGGCIEGALVHEGLAALSDRQPRIVTYGISDDDAFSAGLSCGGTVRLMVEPVGEGDRALPAQLLEDLLAARQKASAVALTTRLADWARRITTADQDDAVAIALARDRSHLSDDGVFIAVHNPPLHLIVVGAVHIAQALVPMARLCGYVVSLIDPRTTFAAAARFPDMPVLDDWPDAAIRSLDVNHRTAIVTLSHDPKLDDPALIVALQGSAFYVGCLGSRRSHDKRLGRLRQAGLNERELARLHAPVGLDIGAQSAAEIAVSILAQMTQTLRRGG